MLSGTSWCAVSDMVAALEIPPPTAVCLGSLTAQGNSETSSRFVKTFSEPCLPLSWHEHHVSGKTAHEIKGGMGSRMVRGSSDPSRLKLERSFTSWAAGGSRLWQAADEI